MDPIEDEDELVSPLIFLLHTSIKLPNSKFKDASSDATQTPAVQSQQVCSILLSLLNSQIESLIQQEEDQVSNASSLDFDMDMDMQEPEETPIHLLIPGYKVVREDLVTTGFLKHFHLAYNTTHHFLVCVECHCGVKPSSVTRHFARNHKIAVGTKAQVKIEAEAQQLGATEELPIIEPGLDPRPPITGLSIKSEYGCLACPVYGKHSYILKHLYTEHKGDTSMGKETIMEAFTQRVSREQGHKKFRVFQSDYKEDNPAPPSKHHRIQALHFLPQLQARDESHVGNEANLAPLVRFMGWHLGIQNKNINGIMHMMDPKYNKHMYPQLPGAVERYLKLVPGLSEKVPKLVRRDLNTPDPSQ
jgi:hypothetical protein